MTQIFRFCLVRIIDRAIPSLFEIRMGRGFRKNPKLCFHNGPVGTEGSRGYAAVLLSPIKVTLVPLKKPEEQPPALTPIAAILPTVK